MSEDKQLDVYEARKMILDALVISYGNGMNAARERLPEFLQTLDMADIFADECLRGSFADAQPLMKEALNGESMEDFLKELLFEAVTRIHANATKVTMSLN